MVARIHHNATDMRPLAGPAGFARFAGRYILMLDVSDLSYGGAALDEHPSDFARREADLRVTAFFGHELRARACAPDKLPAPAQRHLEVVDDRSDRDGPQRERVSRLNVRGIAREDRV